MPRQTAQIFACGAGHTPDRAVAFRVLSGPGIPRCKTGNGRQPFRRVSNFLAPRRQSRRGWVWGCGAAEGIWFGNFRPWLCVPHGAGCAFFAMRNRQWVATSCGGHRKSEAGRVGYGAVVRQKVYGSETSGHGSAFPVALPTRSWTHNTTGSGWQHPVRGHRESEAAERLWGRGSAEGIWFGNFQPWLCIPRSAACVFLGAQPAAGGNVPRWIIAESEARFRLVGKGNTCFGGRQTRPPEPFAMFARPGMFPAARAITSRGFSNILAL